MLFPCVIQTGVRQSEAKSYLARYFTGEAASSQSDEAVRVLGIHANTRSSSFPCVIPTGVHEAEGLVSTSSPQPAHLPSREHAHTTRTDPSVLHITE
jgi:hypothetical protein